MGLLNWGFYATISIATLFIPLVTKFHALGRVWGFGVWGLWFGLGVWGLRVWALFRAVDGQTLSNSS